MLVEARKPGGLSKVRPEVFNERGSDMSSSSTRQRSRTTPSQAEDDGWRVRGTAKRVA